MDAIELKKTIKIIDSSAPIDADFAFVLAQTCSALLACNDVNEQHKVEKIVIHLLNRWDDVPMEVKPIWADIAESVGFYPYIKRDDTMTSDSLSEEMRANYHKSKYVSGVYLHSKQKELSDLIFSGENVVVSAPTSFGKSLLIEEIIASGKFSNIVVIQPTLALLDETRKKLRKYRNRYKVIVRTSQRPAEDKGNLFLLTAERVFEYEEMPHIDFLIVDEFYKLSGRRNDERVDALNNAFLKVWYKDKPQFYMLGPNIRSITDRFKEKFDATFFYSEYSLVDTKFIDKSSDIEKKHARKSKINSLFELLSSMPAGSQSLVYCSGPGKVRSLAWAYTNYLKLQGRDTNDLPLCSWILQNFQRWSLYEMLRYGVGIHDGTIQKHIGASIIEYFNNKQLAVIFCTSTIIEGVNTSAKNVVIFDDTKGKDSQLDYFDYSNIRGRSGRLMEHFVGNVYSYIKVPPHIDVDIDIPFCDQNPISDEVLVHLKKDDVLDSNRERFDKYVQRFPADLLAVFKQNGISIKKQVNVFNMLKDEIRYNPRDIIWKNLPQWNQLLAVFDIAFKCELVKTDDAVHSHRQLAQCVSSYQSNPDLYQIAMSIYRYRMEMAKKTEFDQNVYDAAIQNAFHIHRQWFHFSVPKAMRVMDSIQRYICGKMGVEAGSYSFFVQNLESDYLPDNLTILVEYGIPASTVRKLVNIIPKNINEDDVVEYVCQHVNEFENIGKYERILLGNL